MKKIGILGGTFDPIHRVHLGLAHAAVAECGLDQVWIMPTGNSYLKTLHGHVTSALHREAMARLAADTDPHFRFSDAEWYFIIGADSLIGLKDWYAPEVICRHAVLVAAGRKDVLEGSQMADDIRFLEERYGARIRRLHVAESSLSSSQIRAEIRDGLLPHPDLLPSVNAYIAEHGLYSKPLTAEAALKRLRTVLKPSRVNHTIGVAETARRLAEHYGTVDPERAYLAGILHDCGKNRGTALTHGPVGAVIAREEYGIQDEEILSAIRFHTTGRPAMTDLEKIIFTADYIEPGRDRAPRLEELRKMAFCDLDKTIVCILADTLSYLRDSGADIDESSLQTYNYYKKGQEPQQKESTR